jgi:hypothetical protein
MKLVPLGDAEAAVCADGVCEIPGTRVESTVVAEQEAAPE